MPSNKGNRILAVITPDQIEQIQGKVDWVIPHTRHDAEWERVATQIDGSLRSQEVSPDLHLVITGGHGNVDFPGAPAQLNGQSLATIQTQLQHLKKCNLRFRSILLTSCFSVTFIPEFQELLTENGVIFCQLLSSTHGASELLHLANSFQRDLFSAYYASLECKIKATDALAKDMQLHEPFLSDATYLHQSKEVHCFCVGDLVAGLDSHNQLIAAAYTPDTKDELMAVKNYLESKNIQIINHHKNTDELELSVRNVRDIVFAPMVDGDISSIQPIDALIFPKETPFTYSELKGYFHTEYSFVAKEGDNIIGYVFAHPAQENSLFIGNIGVCSDHQGKGIGSSLLQRVLDKANEQQYAITLRVRANNQNAIKCYAKLGFLHGSADQEWLQMKRPAQHPNLASQPIGATDSQSAIPAEVVQTKQPIEGKSLLLSSPILAPSFILKSMAALTVGAGLLVLACLLLPPVGVIVAGCALGYALASVSGALGLGIIGFWGSRVKNLCRDADVPNHVQCVT